MRVDKTLAQDLFQKVLVVSTETAKAAHEYLTTHKNLHAYGKYPLEDMVLPKSNPNYDEFIRQVPLLHHGLTKYKEQDFPSELINYNGIFWSLINKDTIDSSTFSKFETLIEFVNNHSDLLRVFKVKDEIDLRRKIKNLINDIVVRYLFITQASSLCPENIKEELSKYVEEKLSCYLLDKLKIKILVPICLASFEKDKIVLEEGISIEKIPKEIQKSRQSSCTYSSWTDDWIAAAATHMLVIENYHFTNSDDLSISSATHNSNAYPLDVIDSVFAAIRVATGHSIGYMQILSMPVGWIDSFKADLVPLYGAITDAVNPSERKKIWLQVPICDISGDQSDLICKIYDGIIKANDKRLFFALKRLNRCMLRNESDDMTIDATIGLESLLSGGTKGEITYTISNRIPIVFTKIDHTDYSCSNCRSLMKKLYSYRSKIVHGATIKVKDETTEINGQSKQLSAVAVDFLRYTIQFMAENPEYLETLRLDEYIDKAIKYDR